MLSLMHSSGDGAIPGAAVAVGDHRLVTVHEIAFLENNEPALRAGKVLPDDTLLWEHFRVRKVRQPAGGRDHERCV